MRDTVFVRISACSCEELLTLDQRSKIITRKKATFKGDRVCVRVFKRVHVCV